MVDGKGSPDGELYSHLLRWLFAVAHPIKLIAKERMGRNFVEPPLECLWWSDDLNDFITGKKEKFKWRLMIVATAVPERRLVFARIQGLRLVASTMGVV